MKAIASFFLSGGGTEKYRFTSVLHLIEINNTQLLFIIRPLMVIID